MHHLLSFIHLLHQRLCILCIIIIIITYSVIYNINKAFLDCTMRINRPFCRFSLSTAQECSFWLHSFAAVIKFGDFFPRWKCQTIALGSAGINDLGAMTSVLSVLQKLYINANTQSNSRGGLQVKPEKKICKKSS